MGVLRLLLDTFPDLLNSLDNMAFFEFSKSPVHVSVMIFGIELLCLSTDVESFLIHHMHVVEECKVVVGVGMLVIVLDALLKVLQSLVVIANLKRG